MHQNLAFVPSTYSEIVALVNEEKVSKNSKTLEKDTIVQMDTSSRPILGMFG